MKCVRAVRPAYKISNAPIILRSRFSSAAKLQQTDPQAVADSFLSKFANGKTFSRKQLLDANQLRLFSLTLDRPHLWPGSSLLAKSLEEAEPAQGTPIPPAYHWIYFTPAQLPGILGLDGTDASFNRMHHLRRMWAGGSVEWPGADPASAQNHFLQVGDTVTETTKLLSCVPKVMKDGNAMLVVGVEKEYHDSKGNLCLIDRRNWVFREALDPSKPATSPKKPTELSQAELDERDQGKIVREYNRDELQLFRMSALTFNGHRIHYDKPWATEVEGHRNIVVHGPLNLIAMLDLWRDESVKQGLGKTRDEIIYPRKVDYRATSPVYAGEPYRVLLDAGTLGQHTDAQVEVRSNDGTKCMKGTVSTWQG
ncbi:Mesaconyl-C(4)-CoA hydratase [Cyphellophora attinorum]|uniref:Mesaconyl-C(4)-CoA hydratase n=1 Tax=Cyphellophora attinorum TaxID=1664694 RepID=A0A0N1HI80_9EURO|nr:Mesaconyl-C(4)-CoA hydratase [Phialophora attinorum]KPI45962.1 Mesaconyl-C(4)-CoA hydratase [Phialophora attinorum]